MTRINCIPVEELTDKHLGAEYRELPRVFALAKSAYERGDNPATYPKNYTLGTGHVKFFYARLGFLQERFRQLVQECQRRGRATNFTSVPNLENLPAIWKQNWNPTEEAMKINRERIALRLAGIKD